MIRRIEVFSGSDAGGESTGLCSSRPSRRNQVRGVKAERMRPLTVEGAQEMCGQTVTVSASMNQ